MLTPQELREKSEKLWDVLMLKDNDCKEVRLLESFAREIRNEALEEACACFPDEHEHIPGDFVVEKIRALAKITEMEREK